MCKWHKHTSNLSSRDVMDAQRVVLQGCCSSFQGDDEIVRQVGALSVKLPTPALPSATEVKYSVLAV